VLTNEVGNRSFLVFDTELFGARSFREACSLFFPQLSGSGETRGRYADCYGPSAALKNENTVKKGAVEQTNFDGAVHRGRPAFLQHQRVQRTAQRLLLRNRDCAQISIPGRTFGASLRERLIASTV